MKTYKGFITELKPGQIFVFGSNEAGIHGAGAAKTARKWGAKMGVGVGIKGNTYALPTKNKKIKTLSLKKINEYVQQFLECAKTNSHCEFIVTEVGCGLAGYTVEDIAPLFKDGKDLPNLLWPEKFKDILDA